MDKSVVSVKIYGQEYTVSGDKSREYIIKVADYVDQNMREIAAVAAGIPGPSILRISILRRLQGSLFRKKNAPSRKRI